MRRSAFGSRRTSTHSAAEGARRRDGVSTKSSELTNKGYISTTVSLPDHIIQRWGVQDSIECYTVADGYLIEHAYGGGGD